MTSLELRVPPLAVVAIAAVAMWLCARLLPALVWPLPGRLVSATLAALAGVGIALAGVRAFRRARTTLSPLRPEGASALVALGIYRYTRNPMYLGMLLLLIGWALYLCSLPATLLLPLFTWYLTRFQIMPEERVLAARFGADFANYCQEVRRWL